MCIPKLKTYFHSFFIWTEPWYFAVLACASFKCDEFSSDVITSWDCFTPVPPEVFEVAFVTVGRFARSIYDIFNSCLVLESDAFKQSVVLDLENAVTKESKSTLKMKTTSR
jgi:hypothetical protein